MNTPSTNRTPDGTIATLTTNPFVAKLVASLENRNIPKQANTTRRDSAACGTKIETSEYNLSGRGWGNEKLTLTRVRLSAHSTACFSGAGGAHDAVDIEFSATDEQGRKLKCSAQQRQTSNSSPNHDHGIDGFDASCHPEIAIIKSDLDLHFWSDISQALNTELQSVLRAKIYHAIVDPNELCNKASFWSQAYCLMATRTADHPNGMIIPGR